MAITGRTVDAAAREFTDHLNGVLNKTVTRARLQQVRLRDDIYVSFRESGRPVAAPLRTRFGDAALYVAQLCGSDLVDGRHHLRTKQYTYTITPDGDAQPLLRWEYVRKRDPETATWCRHHLQGPVSLPWGAVDLNDLHLPTGFVPIEDVLRFCIDDLQVRPLASDWHDILEESYRLFRTDFTA